MNLAQVHVAHKGRGLNRKTLTKLYLSPLAAIFVSAIWLSFLPFLLEGAPNYFPNSFTGPLDDLKYSPQTVKVIKAVYHNIHWPLEEVDAHTFTRYFYSAFNVH